MSDVKRLLAEATPLPWAAEMDGTVSSYRALPDGTPVLDGFLAEFAGMPNAVLAVYAVNRLPDYEAAVSALERLADRYWTVPSAYRVKYGLPTRTTVDAEMDDEDRDRQWLREHVNGILARLREKVLSNV